MASTIQLKTGTGSAVPSSLTQGEVGINVDNGIIYYGSGSGNDVKKLESFTNITASGTISASGDIILGEGQTIYFNDDGNSTTFIKGVSNNLRLDADDDILLYPDDDIKIGKGTNDQYAWFYGNEKKFTISGSINTLAGGTAGGHITASGNISSSGNVTAVKVTATNLYGQVATGAQTGISTLYKTDIAIGEDAQTRLDFGEANKIRWAANNQFQMQLEDGIFKPLTDSDVDLGTTSARWKDLYIDSITVTNHISASGTITATTLTGGATGDQSGSLYLSGSLTFRDNAAIPAISASTLYNNNGHLYYGKGLIGGYHLSASADDVGYLKILPNDWVPSDGSGATAYYNGPVIYDAGSNFAVKVNNAGIDLYAFKDIPAGWTAVGFKTYGSSTDTVTLHVYDLEDSTRAADGNTGTSNGAEITLATPTLGTATNYVGLHINPNATTDYIYGGYIKIERR